MIKADKKNLKDQLRKIEREVREASPKIINRSALVLKPKDNLFRWFSENNSKTRKESYGTRHIVYLLPDIESDLEFEIELDKYRKRILLTELSCHVDKSRLKHINASMLKEFFEIEIHYIVGDLVETELERE